MAFFLYPKKMKTLTQEGIRAAKAKTWKQRKCPQTDEQIYKLCYLYTTGILLSHEKPRKSYHLQQQIWKALWLVKSVRARQYSMMSLRCGIEKTRRAAACSQKQSSRVGTRGRGRGHCRKVRHKPRVVSKRQRRDVRHDDYS